MPHRAARREMHARTHTRHQIFKCNSLLLQGCTIFFLKSILVMTWLFVRYHCDSGAFLAQTSQRWKVGNTNEGAYRLPVGHGATRSGETGRSPLRGSRILTQCERSHEKTPCESTQRSQPASFAFFWASDGWSRLTRRIPPNDASIVEYRGASDIRTPPATSKILLKNQWSLTKKNNLKKLFRKPDLLVDNRLDLQQVLLKVSRPCAKKSVIYWRLNYDV